MKLMDVSREFRTEEDCLAELEKVRWPDGVRCITCGCKDVSRINRKPTAKNKRTRSFQCLEKTCKQQFTATHGTMFYRSHIPAENLLEFGSIDFGGFLHKAQILKAQVVQTPPKYAAMDE